MNQKENKKGCHPEEFLFRISSLLKNDRKAGGPEQQHLRTTHCAAFTLIELLVVVLIIGILAAIALPQYEKTVERARIAEAAILLRTISDANRRYHLANNEWAKATELDLLDIEIPGTADTTWGNGRIKTKDFVYSPCGNDKEGIQIARANRLNGLGSSEDTYGYSYYLWLDQDNRLHCTTTAEATAVQSALCTNIETNGSL